MEKDDIAAVGPQEQSLLPRVGQVANDADTPVGRFIGIADRTADRAVIDTGFEPRDLGFIISPVANSTDRAASSRPSHVAVNAPSGRRDRRTTRPVCRGSVLHCLIPESREQFRASDTLEAGVVMTPGNERSPAGPSSIRHATRR